MEPFRRQNLTRGSGSLMADLETFYSQVPLIFICFMIAKAI